MNLGSIIYPKEITAGYILRYIRAMKNSLGSNVETLYRLFENRVEALEFIVKEDVAAIINKPLSELKLKENILICCIQRKGKIITPKGNDTIQVGDSVVIMTTIMGLRDMKDILI